MKEINFNPFPVLKTERLTLREMVAGDAENLFHLRSDERMLTYLEFLKMKDVAEAERYIDKMLEGRKNNKFINWTISTKDHPGLMGTVVLWNISTDNHRAETGYMLAPEFQGKGYMHEALMSVIEYGFKEMGLHSIEAEVDPDNIASTRLLERLKFDKEAHFKEYHYWDGKYSDAAVYSLINDA